MKTNKLLTGALAMILPATLCLSGCSFGIFNTFNYTYENADKYTAGDREIDDKITSINIDYISGDVKVKGSDTDTVSVKEKSNKSLDEDHKVHTWVDGGTLYVRYCVSTKSISFNGIEKDLEITIPEAQELDDFIIDVSSGDMNLSGITSDKINTHASSGDIVLDCSASVIDIKSSSGDVNLNQTGNSDTVNVKVSSGDIVLNHDGDSNSMKVNSSSGKTDIHQAGTVGTADFHSSSGGVKAEMGTVNSLTINVSSGELYLSADDVKDLNTKASSGHTNIALNEAPKTSKLDCSSGGIEVRIPEDSDISVHVDISSGDFNSDIPFTKDGKDYINGNGTAQMNVHCSSGDVSFYKK